MSFDIKADYSFLNSYDYKGKNAVISCLDLFSLPCRSVLGGRNISVTSQIVGPQLSLIDRIFAAVSFIIIFPIGIVSTASLLLKMLTFPCCWEKPKISVQTDEAVRKIQTFTNLATNSSDQAISFFKENKEVFQGRREAENSFVTLIQNKIDKNVDFEELKNDLRLVQEKALIGLIIGAVSKKFNCELREGRYLCSDEIINFVNGALSPNLRNKENIEKCYSGIFSTVLKIESTENVILNAVKIEIAFCLIIDFVINYDNTSVWGHELSHFPLEVVNLRDEILPREEMDIGYLAILSDASFMSHIKELVDGIRESSGQNEEKAKKEKEIEDIVNEVLEAIKKIISNDVTKRAEETKIAMEKIRASKNIKVKFVAPFFDQGSYSQLLILRGIRMFRGKKTNFRPSEEAPAAAGL